MDMLRAIPESHPLHRLFRGLTEYAFMNELGIGDPSLVQYVAELLAGFVPSQALWRLRDAQGRPLAEVDGDGRARPRRPTTPSGSASATATSAISPCSGPASIPRRSASCARTHSPDALINYQEQGRRSYYVASRLSSGSFMSSVFRRLSDEFELCAFGLSCVRREWEKLESEGRRDAASSEVRAAGIGFILFVAGTRDERPVRRYNLSWTSGGRRRSMSDSEAPYRPPDERWGGQTGRVRGGHPPLRVRRLAPVRGGARHGRRAAAGPFAGAGLAPALVRCGRCPDPGHCHAPFVDGGDRERVG